MAPSRSSPYREMSSLTNNDKQSTSMISIPAKPYDYTFSPRRTALIAIDLQRDFIEKGGFGDIQAGGFDANRFDALIANVERLFHAARAAGMTIIHTREGHVSDLSNLPYSKVERQRKAPDTRHDYVIGDQGSNGSRLMVLGERSHDIVTRLQPRAGEIVIDKPGKGSFFATHLDALLHDRQITHLLVLGVTAECCITTTIREANDRGYECCAITDCIEGFHKEFACSSLEMLYFSQGLFGFVAPNSQPLIKSLHQLASEKIHSSASVWSGELDDIEELRARYRDSTLTPREVALVCLQRIDAYEQVDSAVWITRLSKEQVLQQAQDLTARFPDPLNRPLLYGIPFAVKDNIDVEGLPTTAAYKPLSNNIARTSASCVQQLLDQGAILMGKTNLDQFATGLVGTRSPYGAPHSVASVSHISGGSSSGSAVAVGADLVSFSLGTDTAASGRVPAAFNGIIGIKGTVGSISLKGVIPACPSLDCVTVFAKKIGMASQAFYCMQDPAVLSLRRGGNGRFAGHFVGRAMAGRPFTFGLPSTEALLACEPIYQEQFKHTVARLEALGGQSVPFDWSPFERAAEKLYLSPLVAERYGSIQRYITSRIKTPFSLQSLDENVQRALSPATGFSAIELFDTLEQLKALKQQAQLSFSTNVDFLLTPTASYHPTMQQLQSDPVKTSFRLGTFAQSINLLDLCALAVPSGQVVDATGLHRPFGVQLVAPRDEDGFLMWLAELME